MTITLTADHIRAVAPSNPDPVSVVVALVPVLTKYAIDQTPERLGMFLAQWSHESNFIGVREDMNYKDPQRIFDLFGNRGRRFQTVKQCVPLAKNPQRLANAVYNGRMGNRPGSTDGWLYRGGGWPQLTGLDAYTGYGQRLGIDLRGNPDLILRPDVSAAVCGLYWADRHLNQFADAGDLITVTQKINGGQNGADDRLARYRAVIGLLRAAPPVVATTPAPAPPLVTAPAVMYLYSQNRDPDGTLRTDWTSIAVDTAGRVLLGADQKPRTVYMPPALAAQKGLN